MNTDQKNKKNILVVDDDPFMQSLYRKTLEREGFTILTAVDGLAAVEMLPNICVDLIVLDLMLPKIHGLKVLETIRADSHHKNLPVLILSNAYLPEAAQKAMKAEATLGILKSECSPKRLVKIIREALTITPAEGNKQSAARSSWFASLLGNKAENPDPAGGGAKATETAPAESAPAQTSAVSEVQNELLKSWPTDISMIRERCLKYVKSIGSQESEEHLQNLYRRLRLLSARAAMGECTKISQLSNALEAMLFEHGFNSKRSFSASMVQTMVQAVDCLEFLFKTGSTASVQAVRKTRILLVDDDPVCNMANDIALKRANYDTVCATDGVAALALLENSPFDLILLDVNMPVLTGFEVCEKIRKLPRNSDMPVIFVTLLDDFQSRAKSVLSGSNGFIAKPISPLELIVKALVFLLRAQGKEAVKEQPSAGKPAVDKSAAGSPIQSLPAAPPKVEGRVKELQATQAAVEDKVKALTQALAAETKRREDAEQHAAENAKLQSKLEAAQAENQKAQESFQRMLEESQQQIQTGESDQAWKLDGRKRALESVRNFVEDKVKNLKEVLAVQTKRSEVARQQADGYARRKSEVEAALAAIQQAKENLLREIEAAGSGKLRGELEAALAENQKNQASLLQTMEETRQKFQAQQQQEQPAEQSQIDLRTKELVTRRTELEQELAQRTQAQQQLRGELAEQQKQLDAQVQAHKVELGSLAARTQELEATQAALAEVKTQYSGVSEQVRSLTASLTSESGRRATVEQQAAELVARRTELEQELAQRSQAQEQLRGELAEQQKRLEAQAQTHKVELENLSTRTRELEAAQSALAEIKTQQANVTEQVRSLTESLATESGRREAAEKQGTELLARRAELEQELAQRSQTQEQLRGELAEQQKRLEAQVQAHNVELGNLAERTKELESAQSALAEIRSQHANVAEQVRSLTESLAAESGRRATVEQQAADLMTRRSELEQELVQRTQAHEQMRGELAEQQKRLEAQVQAHKVEIGHLAERTKELEAALAALAELKTQHANVTEQLRLLTESLATESGRREAAEKQAAELMTRRSELEQELAQRTQAHEQMRSELAGQQKRLDAQMRSHKDELGHLDERTKEFEAARAALAELKTQHANVAAQVRSLTESLAAESGRRATVEKQMTELVARRTALEQELAQSTLAQEQLRNGLAEQVQAHKVELGHLAERTKELEAARAALAELKTQHANVTAQVRSLTESLATESGRRLTVEQQAAELVARRAELEQELARRSQTHAQLRAELDAQVQAHKVELGHLATRTKELEAAQAALAESKAQHANVAEQVRSLTESLATESGRRATVEKQVTELVARRAELEQELARRSQTHAQLRAELDAQVQAHKVELGHLATRTKELEAAQAALAESKAQHVVVTEQLRLLTESLAIESGRRETVETQMAELVAHRAELEQELARRSQTQEQLRSELAEKKQRVEAISADLEGFRSRADAEALRQKEMAGQIAESEQARTELGKQLNAARELSSTREAAIRALEIELQQRRGEHERLDALFQAELAHRRRLETQIESVQSELEEASSHLAQKCAAEQTWLVRESELQGRLRNQQAEIAKSGEALASQEAEIKGAREKIGEMQVLQSALCAKVQDLTGQAQSLTDSAAAESGRRAAAEKQMTELVAGRTELEQELARRAQTQEQLRGELDAKIQTHNVELGNLAARTKELEATHDVLAELKTQHAGVTEQVRSLTESLAGETGRRSAAEKQVSELVAHRTGLEQELAERMQAQTKLRAELAEQVQAREVELGNLAARTNELEATHAALAELKTRHAGVTEQVRLLTESLAVETGRHAAAAQVWTGRESELQSCLRTQQDQLATSGTTLANQEAEIKNARKKIEDLQVFQSALCAKVQALTEQVDLEAKVIEEWKAKAARSESAVENGLKKMAGLRYAILDASRMSARLHRERSQQERQNLDAMRQLLTSLAQTPLSLAQRGMLAELHHSVDGLKNSRPGSTKIPAYPAEPPSLRGSEFSFAEVTGSAFQTVKMAAEAAGVAVQVSASGTATGKLIGCAEHVHQLITLLAVSPLTIMTGVSALDLRVAIKPRGAKFAEMTMRVALLSDNNPQDLLLRLTSVTAAASALQTGSFCEAELGLAAGWQLTQAMGAQAAFEIEGGKEVCLVLSLPIDLDQPLSPVNGATAPAPARNGNGNVNGNGSHSRNGNGYHLTESHAGIEN